jgi:hypothetical protein
MWEGGGGAYVFGNKQEVEGEADAAAGGHKQQQHKEYGLFGYGGAGGHKLPVRAAREQQQHTAQCVAVENLQHGSG